MFIVVQILSVLQTLSEFVKFITLRVRFVLETGIMWPRLISNLCSDLLYFQTSGIKKHKLPYPTGDKDLLINIVIV